MEAARARQPCHTCLPKIPAAESACTKAAPSRLYIASGRSRLLLLLLPPHSRPKPSELRMASRRRSASFSLER